ncbi:hypothetical protein BDB01DRAFT_776674 [Pilobolus umbonatus]|nr:hypothetical protein BDB01DRAFT_776674 [Pilobolus umbonatus]
MPHITINVRPSTGHIFQVDVDTDTTTVNGLKEIIGARMGDTSASQLKLVFSGRILKNEDMCSVYKIGQGNTLHVVRSGTNRAPSTATEPSTSHSTTSTTVNTPADSIPPIPPTPSPSLLPGLGSYPMGDMQMPNMDPEVMRQMMDSPFVQNMMGNTDFVRSIIMSNPQMKAMVEQNPELGQVISDPAFLRQSMEMMRNPELMREMQRNNDRALSNIEAIPGGFNHLRRIYNTFQSPLESAAASNQGRSSDEANERLARELHVESLPQNSLNTQALPNPWAPHTNTSNTTQSTSTPPTTTGENPFAYLFGGNGGSMPPFGTMAQQQATPSTQPSANAQPSTNAQPSATPFWADPNFIQASLRMQQAMAESQRANTATNTNNNNNNNQQQLLQQMMMGFPGANYGMGRLSDLAPQPTSVEPPEVRFRDQLAQLEEMGFSEKQANVRALLATGGNVEAAIEYLLSSN